MLKIIQARLQQCINRQLPDVQAGFRKAEEPEIKWPTFTESCRKQGNSRKNIYFCFINYPKPLTVRITTNFGKLLKRREYQTTLPVSYKQVKKQPLEPNIEQGTGSKLEKEYVKAVYYHSAY